MGVRLDHFVLTVASPEASAAFYRDAVGAEVVRFGEGRLAIGLGGSKVNLHRAGSELSPRASVPTVGAGDFCIVADEPLDAVAARLRALGVAVELGPVTRTGARGPIVSIYFRDPDGNLVEVANDRL